MNIRLVSAAMALLFVVPLVADGNDLDLYCFGGFTIFPEGTSIETASQEGYGARWGAGLQINDFFGLEVARDTAPVLDDATVLDVFAQDLDDTVTNYTVDASHNRFSSLLGTFAVRVSDYTKIIGKVGYADYSYRSKVEFTSQNGVQFSGKLNEEYGLTPMASFGVEFPFKRGFRPGAGIEFVVSKIFEEEVESVWGAVSFLFRF